MNTAPSHNHDHTSAKPQEEDVWGIDGLRKEDLRQVGRYAVRAGAVVVAIGLSTLARGCATDTDPQTTPVQEYLVQPGDTVGDILLNEVCPTLSAGELQQAQREIGKLNDPSNPASPAITTGETILIPENLYCDSSPTE